MTKVPLKTLGRYSETERNILQQAASILGISVEGLLTASRALDLTPSEDSAERNADQNAEAEDEPRSSPAKLSIDDLDRVDHGPGFGRGLEGFSAGEDLSIRLSDDWFSIPAMPELQTGQELPARSDRGEQLSPSALDMLNFDGDDPKDVWQTLGVDGTAGTVSAQESFHFPPSPSDVPPPSEQAGSFQIALKLSLATDTSSTQLGGESLGEGRDSAKTQSLSALPDGTLAQQPNRKRKRTGSGSKSRPMRRGPFKDPAQRRETGLTRGLVACIRCRMQRIRVSGGLVIAKPRYCLSDSKTVFAKYL